MNRQQLIDAIFRKKSFLCVGLDPEQSKLPLHLREQSDGILQFNRQIIDAVRDYCVAFKPNLAFYEALGPEGWLVLQKTIEYIGKEHFIIADAKRGDIGNTSRMYAEAFFQRMGCDAVTVAPYMGEDSVKPFLDFEGKWTILLALTSNKGAADFQTLQLDGGKECLYEKVVRSAAAWGSPEQMMFVAGATQAESIAGIRSIAPRHFLLVPGVGAQGGDLVAVCRHGMTRECGLLVNASRSILYASSGPDFAEKAAEEAQRMQQDMALLLSGITN